MKLISKRIAVFLLIALFCTGCTSKPSSQQSSDDTGSTPTLLYSNLVDTSSQQEVTSLLQQHGVSQAQTDTLIAWANDFNARVTSDQLPDGFHTDDYAENAYPGLIIENKESEDGMIDPEVNCRLTSFLLMKQFIQTNGTSTDDDFFLMFDIEAIDTYPPFHMSDEERTNFISLFHSVPVKENDTLEQHIAHIQSAWKEREINIAGDGISLITVYVHDPFDSLRFVGHTGVLVDAEDGLLFVEKYGPQYPFQATKFQDRNELKQYLLARADLYGDESELPPIVLENDQVLA